MWSWTQVVMAAVRALAEAHERGVVHRNLRPEHLVLQQRHNFTSVRLVGFGSAAHVGERAVAWTPRPGPPAKGMRSGYLPPE
eukprot:947837-Pyramimonas_sp.AAC.1